MEKEWRLRDSNSRPFGPAPEAGALDHSAKSPMLHFCSPSTLLTQHYLTLISYKAATYVETLSLHQYWLATRSDRRNTRNIKQFTCHHLARLSLLHFDGAGDLAERVDWSVGFACESASSDTALRSHWVVSHYHGTVFEEGLDCFRCRWLS